MRWIYLCIFLLYFGKCNAEAACGPVEFTCKSGRCINLAWKCDGQDDCKDFSDEIDCSTSTTCSEKFFQCDSGRCIPERWVCDDSKDCSDETDEDIELCRNKTCLGYRCHDSSQCIPEEWLCDGYPDCPDHDDETECSVICDPKTEFKCVNDSKCITSAWKCDGHLNCDDGSDEQDCPLKNSKKECETAGDMMCGDGQCITDVWWCDGEADCTDKSDEVNCTQKESEQACGPREFQCLHSAIEPQCILMAWQCDGDADCADQSDEQGCGEHTCKSDEKMCDDKVCLKASYFCDGDKDCEHGEDELNCTHTAVVTPDSRCQVNEFDCGSKCISDQLICNGADDCGNGADEAPERHCPIMTKNVCATNNGGCNQMCIPTTEEESGRRCECYIGFDFNHSETECEDIDECSIPGTCSQICTNTKGSYKCDCIAGYTLTDHRYCKASDGSHAELLLSDRHAIRRYHLETYHHSFLVSRKVSGAVAMDFDIRNKLVFWTDVQSAKIHSLNMESNETKVVLEENMLMPEGLAIDWVHGNMYISDTGLDRIEVARLNGSSRKTLVNDSLDEPKSLVLDPSKGWMYWSDWGSEPKIEKCGMNGQHRMVIVNEKITWPNGLTIDYVQNRLYWVDAKLHTIGSSDLDGKNYKLILKNHRNLGHPFAITVFEDFLYWTDWLSNAVHKVSKFGRDNVSTIALDLKSPMGIHVYHINRQPSYVNSCGSNNGGCSHLCLPVPQMKIASAFQKKSECACPDTLVLDGRFNCVPASSQQTTDTTSSNHSETSAVPNVVTQTSVTTSEPVSDTTSSVSISNSQSTEKLTTVSQSVSVTQSLNETHSKLRDEGENSGYIAVIVITLLVVLGLTISAVAFFLLKRHKSRNVKSMNFDNPVYRKTTTEDQLIMDKNGSRSNLPQSMQPLNQDNDIV